MYSRSSGEARLLLVGVSYSRNHASAQKIPRLPVNKNTQRQPNNVTMAAASGGAITAPRLEPVLKTPNANDRSWGGNHSETAFPEAGKPPPSPSPSKNLA